MNMLSINLQELVELTLVKEREFLNTFNTLEHFGLDEEDGYGVQFEIPATLLQVRGSLISDTKIIDLDCFVDLPCPVNDFTYGIGIDFPMDVHFIMNDRDTRLHKLQLTPLDTKLTVSATVLNNVTNSTDTDLEEWGDCSEFQSTISSGSSYYVDVNDNNINKIRNKHNLLYSLGLCFYEDDLKPTLEKIHEHAKYFNRFGINGS